MNYYDIVVNAARMLNKPKLSKTELLAIVGKIASALGKNLDNSKLIAAWREFSNAGAPRIVYG